jgi:hypothetical protein
VVNNDSAVGANTVKKRMLVKILLYFPLILRLQRMYMLKQMLEDKWWHKKELVNDGKMHNPTDSKACNHVDLEFKWFSQMRTGASEDRWMVAPSCDE